MNERTLEQIREDNETRLRRAAAWIEHAKSSDEKSDQFIFYWIALNAQFTDDSVRKGWAEKGETRPSNMEMLKSFVDKIVGCDKREVLKAVKGVEPPMTKISQLPQTFDKFWEKDDNIKTQREWNLCFTEERKKYRRKFSDAMNNDEIEPVIKFILRRLYVVRNQLFHGNHSRTEKDSFGYTQVRCGAEVLAELTQCFQKIMEDFPDKNWGEVNYRRQGNKDDMHCLPPWLL